MVRLWSASTIKGRAALAAPSATGPPADIQLTLQSVPGVARGAAVPETSITCPIAAQEWTCVVPTGTLDLEFHVRGFISHFHWGVSTIAERATNLGTLSLRQGTSVLGFVRGGDGSPPQAGWEVSLRNPRDGERLHDALGGRGRPDPYAARTNIRGFYQIVDVPPGTYVVAADAPGWARTGLVVEVPKDLQTRVKPLLLQRPYRLDVVIEPDSSPSGQVWAVQLVPETPTGATVAAPTPASRTGAWNRTDVAPGRYSLSIQDSEGTRWHSEQVEVPAPLVSVRIPVFRLAGTVRLAREPLKGRVIFGGRYGAVNISFESDEEGRFGGVFPSTLDAEKNGWLVEVVSRQPPVQRTLHGVQPTLDRSAMEASLDLVLPNTSLWGTAVSDDGHPLRALVNLRTLGEVEGLVQSLTDNDGKFGFSGLPPGPALVLAQARGYTSEEVRVELAEGSSKEVLLVVRALRSLKGRVLSSRDKVGIPAATIRAVPLGTAGFWPTPPARSDADGAFELLVDPDAAELAITVGAVGHALKSLRAPARRDSPLEITLEPQGGTLILEYPRPRPRHPSVPTTYLFKSGALTHVGDLQSWASANAEEGAPPIIELDDGSGYQRLTMPQVTAGAYALCALTVPETLNLAGSAPRRGCTEGTLEAGGTLRLRNP
jgi:hypothetical protein